MIEYRQKEFVGGVLGAGLANLGAGVGTAAGGILKGAAIAGGGLVKGAVPTIVGAGQIGSSALAAGSIGLGKAALWGAAHPLILGGLGAYALYKILKRRRERRIQERGYSVIERMYSDGVLKSSAKRPKLAVKTCSEVSDQLAIPMPIPKAPREEVPKKIVKKAKKSGVVQQDSEGNWRVINMHGPNGTAIYWKPKYSSREKAENALKSYQSGAWSKRK